MGKVSKQSPDHLGLLLYGVFNASIPARFMDGRLRWNSDKAAWCDELSGKTLSEGKEVTFTVLRLMVEDDVLNVIGTLGDVDTVIPKKKRKEKKDKEEKSSHKKEKKSKRKSDGSSADGSDK